MTGAPLRPWQIWTIVIAASAGAIYGAFRFLPQPERVVVSTTDPALQTWIDDSAIARENGVRAQRAATEAVKGLLRDPQSAQFSRMLPCFSKVYPKQAIGAWGAVNSKNGFGGYAGEESFVAINGAVAFMKDDSKFAELFSQCGSPPARPRVARPAES